MLGQLTQSLTDLAARQPLAAVLINQAATPCTTGCNPMHSDCNPLHEPSPNRPPPTPSPVEGSPPLYLRPLYFRPLHLRPLYLLPSRPHWPYPAPAGDDTSQQREQHLRPRPGAGRVVGPRLQRAAHVAVGGGRARGPAVQGGRARRRPLPGAPCSRGKPHAPHPSHAPHPPHPPHYPFSPVPPPRRPSCDHRAHSQAPTPPRPNVQVTAQGVRGIAAQRTATKRSAAEAGADEDE